MDLGATYLEFNKGLYLPLSAYEMPLSGKTPGSGLPNVPIDFSALSVLPLALANLKAKYIPKKLSSSISDFYRSMSIRKRRKILDKLTDVVKGLGEPSTLEDVLGVSGNKASTAKQKFFDDMSKFGLGTNTLEGVFNSGLKTTYFTVSKDLPFMVKGTFFPLSLRLGVGKGCNAILPISNPVIVMTPNSSPKLIAHELKEYFVCQSIVQLLNRESALYVGFSDEKAYKAITNHFLEFVDMSLDLDMNFNRWLDDWVYNKFKRWKGDPKSFDKYIEEKRISKVIPDGFFSSGIYEFRARALLRQIYEKLKEGGYSQAIAEKISNDSSLLGEVIYSRLVYNYSIPLGLFKRDGTYPNIKQKKEIRLAEEHRGYISHINEPDKQLFSLLELVFSG